MGGNGTCNPTLTVLLSAVSLRSLREDIDWTLDRMADAVGLSVSMVIKMERGERDPSWNTIKAFAAALEMTPAELVEELEDD